MLPQVYEYSDYRRFLKDYLSHRKSVSPGYSLSVLGRNVRGLSKAQLSQVTHGKRNIAPDKVSALGKVLGLAKTERQFFECLVHFNQARTNDAKQIFLDRLCKLMPKKEWKQLPLNQYLFAKTWHAPVLRELIRLPSFSDDPDDISLRTKGRVTRAQAAEALQSLLALGLVKRIKGGKYRVSEANLQTTDEVTSLIVQSYHRSCLDLGKQAIATEPVERREYSSLIMPLTEDQFRRLKARLKEFRAEAKGYEAENVDPKKIYQLNVQFFEVAE